MGRWGEVTRIKSFEMVPKSPKSSSPDWAEIMDPPEGGRILAIKESPETTNFGQCWDPAPQVTPHPIRLECTFLVLTNTTCKMVQKLVAVKM